MGEEDKKQTFEIVLKVKLLIWIEDKNHVLMDSPLSDHFISHSKLECSSEDTCFIKENCLCFEITKVEKSLGELINM